MVAHILSFVQQGIDPLLCEVEVDWTELPAGAEPGLRCAIVGLPDAAVKEAKDRVLSALLNSGYALDLNSRVLVNLAPADVRKEGPVYDLPIAVGMLLASGQLRLDAADAAPRRLMMAGELALDGRLRPIHGTINLALLAAKLGLDGVVVPAECASEATAVDGIAVYPARDLKQVVAHLAGLEPIPPLASHDVDAAVQAATAEVDLADIRGQAGPKRALAIAAAGGHNLLMIGPAGTGKTLLAKALPGILPPLSRAEALEVTRIWSSVGKVAKGTPLVAVRPYRCPHHTASPASVIGGGVVPRPGEASLAHHGVLFLDEMPEFPRAVLETLRQPMEDHAVTITRANSAVRFPARFMLVAALNPTPKGDMPVGAHQQRDMERYLSRLSGPLVDRMDVQIEVPRVPFHELAGRGQAPVSPAETSAEVRARVVAARRRQTERNGSPLKPNAALSGRELDRCVELDPVGFEILRRAMTELGLSARAYDRIRRVARTIADLEGRGRVSAEDVAEAVQYRLLDRKEAGPAAPPRTVRPATGARNTSSAA